MAQNKTTSLPIAVEQSLQQLRAIGYSDGDRVCLRKFPPKGGNGYPKNYEYIFPNLPTLQDDDGGLYFAVNGGPKDADVTQYRAVFFEFDDRPVEDQLLAWQEFDLPEPTIQVSSRKSIHTYYALSDGCTEARWRELQEDLSDYLGSDRTLKNPSRVMRLAGAWHIKPDEDPFRCELVQDSGKRYTYAELRRIIPKLKRLESLLQPTPAQSLSDVLYRDIYPRLSPEQLYYWNGHKWKRDRNGKKYRGCCPWHDSQSGTAFYADLRDGVWLWRCPQCEIGGSPIEYRHRIKGGYGAPKGREFIEIVKELASEAGVTLPEYTPVEQRSIEDVNIGDRVPPVSSPAQPVKQVGYDEALDHIDRLEEEYLDDVELEWQVREYAYESGLAKRGLTGSALLRMTRARRDTQKSIVVEDAIDILHSKTHREWLIAGLLPLGSTIVFSAGGGSGKTMLLYSFAKHLALGSSWSELPTMQCKSLIVQADEPLVDIQDKLDCLDYYNVPRNSIGFIRNWKFTQIRQLESIIRKCGYKFVVIDSYTAAHSGMGVDLAKSSGGDSIYKLRDMADDLNCTIVIVHHNNKTNDFRDSSTIKDNCSEMWNLTKPQDDQNFSKDDWCLDVPKSRSGLFGRYKLTRKSNDYSWLFRGSVEGDDIHVESTLRTINDNPTSRFSPKDISEETGMSFNSASATLEKLRRIGLISAAWQDYDRNGERSRFRLYFANPKEDLEQEQSTSNVIEFAKAKSSRDRVSDVDELDINSIEFLGF